MSPPLLPQKISHEYETDSRASQAASSFRRFTLRRLALLPILVIFIFICTFYVVPGVALEKTPAASTPSSIPSSNQSPIRTLVPNQPDAKLAEAKSLLDHGKTADADRVVREYIGTHPNSADAHFLLGYILFKQIQAHSGTMDTVPHELYKEQGTPVPGGGFPEAAAKDSLAEFTEGAKFRKPTAFDLKIVALDYVVLGDYVDADKWLTHALQLNPGDPDAWYLLGRTKYSENRFAEAISAFQQCLKLDPKNVKAEDNLGLSLAGLGRNDEAAVAYRQAIAWQAQSTIKNPGPYIDIGSLLMDENRPQDALAFLLQATEIAGGDSRAHELLGKAYARLEELPKAQAELEKAIELSPQTPNLHCMLAPVYRKQGLAEKAKIEFERCAAMAGSHSTPETPRP